MSTTTTTTSAANTTGAPNATTSPGDGSNTPSSLGPTASIGPAVCCMLTCVYMLCMLFHRRAVLYHVWNHLTVVMFSIYFVRSAFLIGFLATPDPDMSCAFGVTFLDTLHGAYNITLMLLFCVMMFPVCQEPERRKLGNFKLVLTGVTAMWALLQIALYLGAGSFHKVDKGTVCEIEDGQLLLNSLFLWVPCYLDCLLAFGFLCWLRSRRIMIDRRRVNVFGIGLFVGVLMDTIGTSFTIAGIAEKHQIGKGHHGGPPDRRISGGEIVFVDTLFTTLHVMLVAASFIYAEDLVPLWLREFCCAKNNNGAMMQQNNGAFVDGLRRRSTASSAYSSSTQSVQDPASPQRFDPVGYGTSSSSEGSPHALASTSPIYPGGHHHNSDYQNAAAASSRANSATPLSAYSGGPTSPLLQPHTLTYFLMMMRSDIVSERNVVDSIVIRQCDVESGPINNRDGAASLGGGASTSHFDDDIVSRSSQVGPAPAGLLPHAGQSTRSHFHGNTTIATITTTAAGSPEQTPIASMHGTQNGSLDSQRILSLMQGGGGGANSTAGFGGTSGGGSGSYMQ